MILPFIGVYGSGPQKITAYSDDVTHAYANPGDYTIKITGPKFPAWSFDNKGDKNKIIEVKKFEAIGWKSFIAAFSGCQKLTTFNVGETDTISSYRYDLDVPKCDKFNLS